MPDLRLFLVRGHAPHTETHLVVAPNPVRAAEILVESVRPCGRRLPARVYVHEAERREAEGLCRAVPADGELRYDVQPGGGVIYSERSHA